ncbi:hypothetical protein JCM11641_008207 [Rhodosporidiobolus odoratus]
MTDSTTASTSQPSPPSSRPASPRTPPPVDHLLPSDVEPHPDAAIATSHVDLDQPDLNQDEQVGAVREQGNRGKDDMANPEQVLAVVRPPIGAEPTTALDEGESETLDDQVVAPNEDTDAQYLAVPSLPRSSSFDPYGEPTPPAATMPLPPVSTPPPSIPSSGTPASPSSPTQPSLPKLGLKTHPADLVSPSNPDPHAAVPSVPNTPISPTAGDAGHGDSLSLLGHGSHAGHGHGYEASSSTAASGSWRRNGSEATALDGEQGSRRNSEDTGRMPSAGLGIGEAGRTDAGERYSATGDGARLNGTSSPEGTPTEYAPSPNAARPWAYGDPSSNDPNGVEALHPASLASSVPSPSLAPAPRPPPPSTFNPSTPAKRASHGRAASIATGSPSSSHASNAYARGADLLFSPTSPLAGSPPQVFHERQRSASTTAPLSNGNGSALSPVAERSSAGAEASSARREGAPSRHGSVSSSTAPSRRGSARECHPERERERDREKDREREAKRDESGAPGQSRSRRQLGEWQMTKTLGAGSMGKVKLGVSSQTGDKVAIKIIPRFTSTASAHRQAETRHAQSDPTDANAPPPKPTQSFLAKAAVKDASKEVRTVREGSLSLLLHHPYVCGMKEMLVYPHHYYFVQEYVNGGQMLDYIISHGRLRERSARKFARQIGSALEYCHANSIVHRDLKIENILISKTGNIKIIDFGLSNLYSPVSHLTTFCGSLYFAAPELLNAKPYTGPEVDVWSFGIVLYVLVCGKVPFDDQSMPALHAKIKRGQVEYPNWLSAECKHLLSRMLVTVPSQRATLTEVLAHPWICKGFTSSPAAHIPSRVPLRFGELDSEVIRGMTGFEFGTEAEIAAKLGDVLQSDLYRQAVRNWEAKRNMVGAGASGDGSDSDRERPAMRTDGRDMKRSPSSATKRFSGLGFYGKKLAGGFNAAFAGTAAPTKAGDELEGLGGAGGGSYGLNGAFAAGGGTAPRPDQLDPTKGFHPLVSIYYLVKEKIERERIWGPGVFASSTLSLTGPPAPPAPPQAYQAGSGLASPPPAASPLVPMTPQPRQRATGDEFYPHPSTAPQVARTSVSEYRSPSPAQRPISPQPPAAPATPIPMPRPQNDLEPHSPSPRQRKASNRMSLMLGGGSSERAKEQQSQLQRDDVPLSSSSPSSGGFAKRFGSLLGRSSPSPSSPDGSSPRGHRTRASIGGMGHKASNKTAASPLPQVAEGLAPPSPTPGPAAALPSSGSDVPLASPPDGKPVHRASTVGEISPSRHARGVSIGAATMAQQASPGSLGRAGGGFFERRRQASLSSARGNVPPRPKTHNDIAGMFDETAEEELADVDPPAATEGAASSSTRASSPITARQDVGFVGRTSSRASAGKDSLEKAEGAKPVWLKGLFSVSTTSTKPVATLRADLVKVLDRLGVQHRDVKNGFECAHVPSIDLSSVGGGGAAGPKDKTVRSTIKRRASKLLLSSKDGEKHSAPDDSQTSLQASTIAGTAAGATTGRGESSSSFTPVPLDTANPSSSKDNSPTAPGSSRFEGSTAANPAMSNDLIVRFEIFLVKMPLLPGIHGLQFRRIGGNAWQYQMLARRVLQELKL